MSSQVKQSKAWKKYNDAKAMIKANPEMSWLGDEEGLFFDQKIRSLNQLCASLELDIDLRQSMFMRNTQKFTHEDNMVKFAKEEFDTITKLSIKSGDEKPRKEKVIEVVKADTLDEAADKVSEVIDNHRAGKVE